MKREEYNNKIYEYIDNNNIMQIHGDPTKQYQNDIKDAINKAKHFLSNNDIRFNKMIKPHAPNIRGMPKIHKINMPIRPLINFTTAPTYRIARHINKWLTNNITIDNNHSIKNNLELINKIENISIPHNGKMASFDITNMYSNVPIKETIRITEQLLRKNHINNSTINEIINLLEVITNQNYFQYQDKFFKHIDGLPMGSPLSGTLANIYLNYIENEYIINYKNKYMKHIKYWHRYVDDIIMLFTGTQRQMDLLHKYINSIHKNIKFTLEVEQEKSINFLDLTINNFNNNHTFKIYRKPTQTVHTIHSSSNHPYQHKMAAYNHMINRVNCIPMSEMDYKNEIDTIKFIAYNNGYKTEMIDNMNNIYRYKKHRNDNTTLNDTEHIKMKYVTVEYNKNTSKHFQKILRKHGYKAAYKTKQKMETYINAKSDTNMETGIYKLTCTDCDAFYIGQTGRSFNIRYNEHTKDIGKQKTESRFALHINETKHKCKGIDENMKIMHRVKKGDMMNRIEEYEIYKVRRNKHILNNKINTNTNKIYDMILEIETRT